MRGGEEEFNYLLLPNEVREKDRAIEFNPYLE